MTIDIPISKQTFKIGVFWSFTLFISIPFVFIGWWEAGLGIFLLFHFFVLLITWIEEAWDTLDRYYFFAKYFKFRGSENE